MNKATTLSRGALLCALCVGLLLMGNMLPTLRLSLCAMAGGAIMLASAGGGVRMGFTTFAASGLLAFFLPVPREAVGVFLLFFGWFGAIWPPVTFMTKKSTGLFIKFLLFNLSLFIGMGAFEWIFKAAFFEGMRLYGAALLLNAAFYLYDKILCGVYLFYVERIITKR